MIHQHAAPTDEPTIEHEPARAHDTAGGVGTLSVGGSNASVARALATTAPPPPASPFRGALAGVPILARKDVAPLPGSKNKDFPDAVALPSVTDPNGVVGAGQAGYADAMERQADDDAGEHLKDMTQLSAVACDTSGIDGQLQQRENEMKWADEGLANRSSLVGSSSQAMLYNGTKSFAQAHHGEIKADKDEMQALQTAFAAQLPTMNATFSSNARFLAMADVTGGKDLPAKLLAGIKDARSVLAGYLKDYRGEPGKQSKQHTTEELKAPQYKDSLKKHTTDVDIASRKMSTAYTGLQSNINRLMAAKFSEQAKPAEARLKEIESNKAAVKKMGGALDTSVAIINGAPGAITSAETNLAKAGAHVGAMKNKQAIKQGGFGKHNPTYMTVDEKGNFVVKNVQTGGTRNADGSPMEGEPKEIDNSAPLPEIKLPKSVEETLGTIADFYYADEVKKLTLQVTHLKDKAGNMTELAEAQDVAQKAGVFQDAALEFAEKCNAFQQAVMDRRESYREIGRKLDHFAQRSPEMKKQGLDVKGFGDRFTTLFVMIAQLREANGLGKAGREGPANSDADTTKASAAGGGANAAATAKSPDAIRETEQKFTTRRAKPKAMVCKQLAITPAEKSTLKEMREQLKTFGTMTKNDEGEFAKVEAEFQAFLTDLGRVGVGTEY